jgi:hypothetical protein
VFVQSLVSLFVIDVRMQNFWKMLLFVLVPHDVRDGGVLIN